MVLTGLPGKPNSPFGPEGPVGPCWEHNKVTDSTFSAFKEPLSIAVEIKGTLMEH